MLENKAYVNDAQLLYLLSLYLSLRTLTSKFLLAVFLQNYLLYISGCYMYKVSQCNTYENTILTPPLRPPSNVPFPRPPAKT